MHKLRSALWQIMLIVGVILLMVSQPLYAEPSARITDGQIVIAVSGTNGVSEKWADLGEDSSLISFAGTSRKAGAGAVRSVMYSVTGPVTNGAIAIYAYDGAIERRLFSTSSVIGASSARYDFSAQTNLVYTGRFRVEVEQTATNAACTWVWSAIVE